MTLRTATLVVALAIGMVLAPLAADAQAPGKVARIGVLASQSLTPINAHILEAFRNGLRDLGWVEGENLVIEWRRAEGKVERLPTLAAELVRLNVDVLVALGTPPSLAASRRLPRFPSSRCIHWTQWRSGWWLV